MKLCKTCGQLKDESEFRINNGRPGLYCNACYLEGLRTKRASGAKPQKRVKKSKGKCKCHTCQERDNRITVVDGQKMIVCNGEACFLNCNECEQYPVHCGYKKARESA